MYQGSVTPLTKSLASDPASSKIISTRPSSLDFSDDALRVNDFNVGNSRGFTSATSCSMIPFLLSWCDVRNERSTHLSSSLSTPDGAISNPGRLGALTSINLDSHSTKLVHNFASLFGLISEFVISFSTALATLISTVARLSSHGDNAYARSLVHLRPLNVKRNLTRKRSKKSTNR